ncbi:MAG TPA: universal stress protein [Solirubrobacterales bacterium]|nr:universal stress protein [Solirubrobacterales bacterium]
MKLLIGLDSREGGKDALELARVLAASAGENAASAVVVTVLYGGPLPMEYALLPNEEAREAEPLFEQARERLPGMELATHAYGGGSPAGILTMLAEREQFDAIVVGSPHRSAFGQVMIGSVANSLLNGAPVDVAVAPRGYAQADHGALRSIAVGYDGTPEAKVALRHAEEMAKPCDATIGVVTVIKPPVPAPVMVPVTYTPQFPSDPERVVNEGVDSIDPRLAASRTLLEGDPATKLAKACEDDADLLVIGSRGYGPMARVLLGSVSRHVVQKAPCPVLVARRP